jgi:hypothetical protein
VSVPHATLPFVSVTFALDSCGSLLTRSASRGRTTTLQSRYSQPSFNYCSPLLPNEPCTSSNPSSLISLLTSPDNSLCTQNPLSLRICHLFCTILHTHVLGQGQRASVACVALLSFGCPPGLLCHSSVADFDLSGLPSYTACASCNTSRTQLPQQ